jgi:RimJ/RimL family protein N-acetyltransferase
MSAPRLETERLILRGPCRADFPVYCRMWADPANVRPPGGKPFSEEEEWQRVMDVYDHWTRHGYGFWVIAEKLDNVCVGEVCLTVPKSDIDPPLDARFELGIALDPTAHGKGYATEAGRAAIAWARRRFGPIRLCGVVEEDNAASLRLTAKVGLKEALRTRYRGKKVVVFYADP